MKQIDGIFQKIQPITEKVKSIQPQKVENSAQGSFAEALGKAIGEVNSMQQEADLKVAGLVAGTGEVTPHDAMIALEKADVAFNLMTQIRSKIVRAYEEVMRTQV